jgi:uncharacterized protein
VRYDEPVNSADAASLLLPPDYPCLGALAAAAKGRIQTQAYEDMTTAVERLAEDLAGFTRRFPKGSDFRSFVALFTGPPAQKSTTFESRIWTLLCQLARASSQPWPANATTDPGAPDFKFYFEGQAWFIVGLSPTASRRSRRSPTEGLAFNPSAMFEALRAGGAYDRMAARVRERDHGFSGDYFNSAVRLSCMGDAPQFSGEEFTPNWKCPEVFSI